MALFGGPADKALDGRGYYSFDGNWAHGSDLVIFYFSSTDIQARATSMLVFGSVPYIALPNSGHWLVQNAIPEPSSVALGGSGILLLLWRRNLRFKSV